MRSQYGALPVVVHDGEPMVMLVTSRGAGRWIIPKGRPEKGVAPHKLAAREAWEEAGCSAGSTGGRSAATGT